MRNTIRISNVRSSSCFNEDLSSSSCFIKEEQDFIIAKASNYVVRMSQCWKLYDKLNLSIFNSERKSDIVPFAFCWSKCIFFSHECFRNADISFLEDFEISSYTEADGNFSKDSIFDWNDVQEDYVFHMRFAFKNKDDEF